MLGWHVIASESLGPSFSVEVMSVGLHGHNKRRLPRGGGSCRFGGAQKQHPMEGAKSGEQRGQREAGPYRTREAHRTRGTQELRAASPRLIAMACFKGVCIEGSDCVF